MTCHRSECESRSAKLKMYKATTKNHQHTHDIMMMHSVLNVFDFIPAEALVRANVVNLWSVRHFFCAKF